MQTRIEIVAAVGFTGQPVRDEYRQARGNDLRRPLPVVVGFCGLSSELPRTFKTLHHGSPVVAGSPDHYRGIPRVALYFRYRVTVKNMPDHSDNSRARLAAFKKRKSRTDSGLLAEVEGALISRCLDEGQRDWYRLGWKGGCGRSAEARELLEEVVIRVCLSARLR